MHATEFQLALASITAYKIFVCLFWLFYDKEGQALNYSEVVLELRGPEGLKSTHWQLETFNHLKKYIKIINNSKYKL